MRRAMLAGSGLLFLVVVYFTAWPVPVDPLAWEAPPNPGYTGVFAVDSSLAGVEKLGLGDAIGPESVARDGAGDGDNGGHRCVRIEGEKPRARRDRKSVV